MNKKIGERTVRTHMDDNGILIFRLQCGKKQRTMHTFGYGTYHKVWLRVEGEGSATVTMIAEPASVVKEEIARWGR